MYLLCGILGCSGEMGGGPRGLWQLWGSMCLYMHVLA